VASQYEAMLRSGMESGAVLYNLGNAYMRAGERGRAIAAYRRAQRYRPHDPLLDANLQSALNAIGTAPETSQPLLEYVLFWQNWISYPRKFQLSVALAVVAFSLGVIHLLVRKRVVKRLAVLVLLLTLASSFSAMYDWYRFEYTEHGVIASREAIARKGNAESYEPAFTRPLVEGTEFVVRERRGDWLRIRLTGKQEAWVRMMDVMVY
jgi:hypothetical protein